MLITLFNIIYVGKKAKQHCKVQLVLAKVCMHNEDEGNKDVSVDLASLKWMKIIVLSM